MRYPINPEFDERLKEVFDEIGYPEGGREAILELMDRAAIAYADKVCLRIAKSLVEEGLSTGKIKRITGCDVEEIIPTIH